DQRRHDWNRPKFHCVLPKHIRAAILRQCDRKDSSRPRIHQAPSLRLPFFAAPLLNLSHLDHALVHAKGLLTAIAPRLEPSPGVVGNPILGIILSLEPSNMLPFAAGVGRDDVPVMPNFERAWVKDDRPYRLCHVGSMRPILRNREGSEPKLAK